MEWPDADAQGRGQFSPNPNPDMQDRTRWLQSGHEVGAGRQWIGPDPDIPGAWSGPALDGWEEGHREREAPLAPILMH